MRFGYELVVGTCRAARHHAPDRGSTSKTQVGKGAVSRVMKVPIRVYNNVSGGSCVSRLSSAFFDVCDPSGEGRKGVRSAVACDPAEGDEGREGRGVCPERRRGRGGGQGYGPGPGKDKFNDKYVPHTPHPPARADPDPRIANTFPAPTSSSSPSSVGTFGDLQEYARRLLGTFSSGPLSQNGDADAQVRVRVPTLAEIDALERERDAEREAECGLTGCREAVEILTRNPKRGA
jgi:hypothetical protein